MRTKPISNHQSAGDQSDVWSKLIDVKNGYAAEVWKELFDAEGIATRVVPSLASDAPMAQAREIWVPDSKTHVAQEIMRKI